MLNVMGIEMRKRLPLIALLTINCLSVCYVNLNILLRTCKYSELNFKTKMEAKIC